MNANRLEAFSDGVIAIIITVMVLELHVPEEATLSSLVPLIPKFLAYALSFASLGIYWNNHHHLLKAAKTVNGQIMWTNLHLLFWLSLVPFVTAWLGEHYTEAWPTAFYGIVHLTAAFAYQLLQKKIVKSLDKGSPVVKNIGKDMKGFISLGLYVTAVIFAFVNPIVSDVAFFSVALIWFIPDQRLHPTT